MKERIRLLLRRLILWACPEVTFLTGRQLDRLRDRREAPDAHDVRGEASRLGAETLLGAHEHKRTGAVPGAHVWVLLFLICTAFHPIPARGQGGAQTSSVPPLTGTAAPTGNCGAGSLYVNTTTGDLYDCNGGAWNKVNGSGSGAFSGGLGTSYQDAGGISAPSNPASGNARLFYNSGTSLLACLTSSGANCMPSGGAGTVTQVTSGNFSPLFNVSVVTNTTTPAFSFAAIGQSPNLFFASPNGASGNPAFRSMVAADLPAGANSCATHQFTISLAAGLTVTCAQPQAGDIGGVPGTSGQLLYNNAGAIGAEDPIVSGPTAIGSAPSATNPVFVATWDGTAIRVPVTSNVTPGSSDYALEVRNIPSGTQSVSISGTPSVSISGTPSVSVSNFPSTQAVSCTTANCTVQVGDSAGDAQYIDPCRRGAKSYYPVNFATATTSTMIAGASGKKTYICEINLVVAVATNIGVLEGTGANCSTVTAGLFGGTTAATGWNFAANGGIALGNGDSALAVTATAADNVCISESAANQVSGDIVYVQY